MEIFGELERFLSEDIYPYRVPVTLALVAALAGLGVLAWRRGWLARLGAFVSTRPVVSAVVAVALLATVLPSGYYLLSPLWTRTMLVEDSPLAVAATAEATSEADRDTAATPAASPTASVSAPAASGTAEAFQPQTVAEGEWEGADDFHFAEGSALIIETAPGQYTLRVEDFSVRNGPDLFVFVSPAEGYDEAAVNLGELKATDGAFNYEIPPDVDVHGIRSVVVWCRDFAVLFGTAVLQ